MRIDGHVSPSGQAGAKPQLTMEEAAKHLRVSYPTLRKLAKEPGFPKSARAGRRRLFSQADIDAWLASQQQQEGAADGTQAS